VIAAYGAPAWADQSVTGLFSQRFQARGNDGALRSATDLGVVFRDLGDGATWTFSPGARLTVGDDEDPRLAPRLSAAYARSGPRRSIDASLNVTPNFIDETQFDDTGRSQANGIQVTTAGRVGFTYAATALDRFGFGASARSRDFIGDAGTLDPTRSFGVTTSYRRLISPLSSLSISPGARFFFASGDRSDGVSLSAPVGFQTSLTPLTAFSASVGPSISSVDDGDRISSGVVGGLGITSRGADYTVSLRFNQDVDQNSDGDLETRSSLNVSSGYRINARERLSAGAGVAIQDPLGDNDGERVTASLTAGYARDVTQDWSVRLDYRLRLSNDDDFDASNSFFLSISRGLSLLP
jgi:hypothetical protein